MNILNGSPKTQNDNMALKLEDTMDNFVALDSDTSDFIAYIGGIIKEEISHDAMIAIIQMQTKIFSRIEKIESTQQWIINHINKKETNLH